MILAAEEVRVADPTALPLAVAAQQAVHFLGMPETRHGPHPALADPPPAPGEGNTCYTPGKVVDEAER